MFSKEQQRRWAQEHRHCLSAEEKQRSSHEIFQQLQSHPRILKAQSIHCYLALPAEVQTKHFIEFCWQQRKQVVVPVTKTGSYELQHSYLSSWDHLTAGKFNVLEPAATFYETADLENIDVVIVPGLAFDEKGHRMGYGKGYYDRFLQTTRAYKIGLCFSSLYLPRLFAEVHDVPMDEVIRG